PPDRQISIFRCPARQLRAPRASNSEFKTKLGDFAYKFPPTLRGGLVWPRPHRPALILLFAKKFFRLAFAGRMRWTGQIFWLLALPSSRLHPRKLSRIGPWGSRIQLQQRNCSRFSRDSCADPLFQARKERSNGILPMITGSKPVPRLGTCARRVKIYLINQTV